MESLLKRGKKFYKENETAINVGMLFIPGVGLLGQGVVLSTLYQLKEPPIHSKLLIKYQRLNTYLNLKVHLVVG